jgi:hypothetical protein
MYAGQSRLRIDFHFQEKALSTIEANHRPFRERIRARSGFKNQLVKKNLSSTTFLGLSAQRSWI